MTKMIGGSRLVLPIDDDPVWLLSKQRGGHLIEGIDYLSVVPVHLIQKLWVFCFVRQAFLQRIDIDMKPALKQSRLVGRQILLKGS